jgi:hypothetical protein
MKQQFHVPPNRIDYVVLSMLPGLAPEWIAFTKAPSHPGYGAKPDGLGLHKL